MKQPASIATKMPVNQQELRRPDASSLLASKCIPLTTSKCASSPTRDGDSTSDSDSNSDKPGEDDLARATTGQKGPYLPSTVVTTPDISVHIPEQPLNSSESKVAPRVLAMQLLTEVQAQAELAPEQAQAQQEANKAQQARVEAADERIEATPTQNSDSDPEGVVAIRYNGLRKLWTVWWEDMTHSYLPLRNLDGIDKVFLKKARQQPGKRIKLTGSRCGADADRSDSVGSLRSRVPFQEAGGYCALHSVARVVSLSDELYESIRSRGKLLPLEKVCQLLNQKGTPCQLHRVKVENTHLLAWLLQQTTGIFSVEFGAHCISWDADKQEILETDPSYPPFMPINDETLMKLGIWKLEKAYRIVLCTRGIRKRKCE